MKGLSLLVILLFTLVSLNSIQVGGTMTQDTIWSPADNPVQVLEHLIISEGVTLTILPGTEIYIRPRQILTFEQYMAGVEYAGGTSEHKIIWCYGNIIAEGTADNPIIFTRMNDEVKTFWGGILFYYGSEWGVFRNCQFSFTSDIMIGPGSWVIAALSNCSANLIVQDCEFFNCWGSIDDSARDKQIEIISSSFITDDELNYTDDDIPVKRNALKVFGRYPIRNEGLIANCYFENFNYADTDNLQWCFNTLESGGNPTLMASCDEYYNFFYGNSFTNAFTALHVSDVAYIRNNRFISGNESIDGNSNVKVVNNYFFWNEMLCDDGSTYVNNKFFSARCFPTRQGFSNNVLHDIPSNESVLYGLENCHNNASINNYYGASFTGTFVNDIIVGNDNVHPTNTIRVKSFQNCIIDFPIEGDDMVDLGGNIFIDPDSIASLFLDYEGRDFRPAPGSPAIDAGCWVDTLSWCEYAGGFTERFWDGDGDGIAQPDIGPYEYGAPALGGIKGYTRKSTGNNEIVPYVLIHNAYDYSEFVISDSLGYYELPLTAGRYEFVVQRVFYDSLYVHKQVNADYSWNESDIFLVQNTTYNDEYEISPQLSSIEVSNFPNPFNPSTTISYSSPESGDVEVTIFNVRGQLVKQLYKGFKPKGGYNIKWDGTDEHNNTVATGVYFTIVKTGNEQKSNKMLLMK